MEHKIKPHKGGRTERVSARVKPGTRRKLDTICQQLGISLADWIEKQVEASANPGASKE